MKKILFCMILLFPIDLYAIDLKATYQTQIYSDNSLERGQGLKLELGHECFYLWGSKENTQMRLYGQRAGDINLYGLGAGMRIKLADGVVVKGDFGYFIPDSALSRDPARYGETLYYAFRKFESEWGVPNLSRSFGYDIKGNIGGSVGLDFERKIYKGIYFNLNSSYRGLKLKETFYEAYNGYSNFLEHKGHRNFSSFQIGIGFSYHF